VRAARIGQRGLSRQREVEARRPRCARGPDAAESEQSCIACKLVTPYSRALCASCARELLLKGANVKGSCDAASGSEQV
jgi:hypothetical protein